MVHNYMIMIDLKISAFLWSNLSAFFLPGSYRLNLVHMEIRLAEINVELCNMKQRSNFS